MSLNTKNDKGSLKNDKGSLKNDKGSLKNDKGSLKNDKGSLKNDKGSLKNDKQLNSQINDVFKDSKTKFIDFGEDLNKGYKDLQSKVDTTTDKVKNQFIESFDSVKNKISYIDTDSNGFSIVKILLMVGVTIGIIYLIKYFYDLYNLEQSSSPYLINGTKNGKNAYVVSQNPKHINFIPMNRSIDRGGIELSYSFWMLINDMKYKDGEWKHVFHKGDKNYNPNKAPGVWIHPSKNALRVYMNTQDDPEAHLDIHNIPVRKWLHVAITLKNTDLDVYINGYLKSRKTLKTIPVQNNRDLWVNIKGGFDGYISKLRYYDHAIDFNQIDNDIKGGPSGDSCIDTNETPPYLDNKWWFSDY
jgi:hypothetical protein